MKRKGPRGILAVGLVGQQKRRGTCIRVASLEHRECLFIFSKNIFIYLLYIYFNWRLITLQYCIGFAIPQHLYQCYLEYVSTRGHLFIIFFPVENKLCFFFFIQ